MSVSGGANVRHDPGLMGFFNLAGPLAAIMSEIKEPPPKIGQSYKDGLETVFWHHNLLTPFPYFQSIGPLGRCFL